MDTSESKISAKNSQLTQELMSNTLVNEVTRVMISAPTLNEALHSYFLGINEITGISRMILFKVDRGSFSLAMDHCYGIEPEQVKKLNLPLHFSAGEYPDAIFLNKHIIIDQVGSSDPFHHIDSSGYVVMPILSRITTRCWEFKQCNCTECPCYEGHNPYCWSIMGAAQFTNTKTEDEKRRACTICGYFACHNVLWLDMSDLPSTISADAVAHLTGLNQHIGMVIETFTMYDEIKEANGKLEQNNTTLSSLNKELNLAHARINRELDQAKIIQKGLLPESFPEKILTDVSSRYIPAGKVGGDYYDSFKIDRNLLGIVMADVSGHGIAAALIMSMFKVLLKTFSPMLKDPLKVLLEINEIFLNEIKSTNYVTVFFGVYDKSTRELTYCNAGHPPQLLLSKDGHCAELGATGLFVGILEETMLQKEKIKVGEGARLALFTDGILEAKNPQNEMYTFERFKDLILSTSSMKVGEVLNHIMKNFDEFRQEKEVADDITLLLADF